MRRLNRQSGLLLVVGLTLALSTARAQTFSEIDASTYALYMQKDWEELIRAGKDALRQDVDYYYLRMRIGIAYYEKKNYKSAQSQFQKALDLNQGDPLASEYLYYSYLLATQTQQAALLYKGFSPSLQEKLTAPDQKAVDRASAEYLYNMAFIDVLVGDTETFAGLPSGMQILTRNYHNLNISLQHCMHPGTSYTHAYTYLGKTNYYYYDDGTDKFGVEGQKVSQHQYYLSPSFTSKGGLVFSPLFHFLSVGYGVPAVSIGGGGGGPGGGGSTLSFTKENTTQMVGGLSLTKYQGAFSIRAGGTYSSLNNANQLTGFAGLTWYPLGNADMYLGASLNAHLENANSGSVALIPDAVFGLGIASKVWIEFSGTYGDMKNYTESNGYIVYNGLDWMKYKAMGNLMVPITKKGSLIYAGARFAQMESRFIPFDKALATDLNSITFNSLSIFGGLSWKF